MPDPVRRCIGCGRRAEIGELVRFGVRGGDLTLSPKGPGRGAWLCRTTIDRCFGAASDKNKWANALRSKIRSESISGLYQQFT